MAIKGGQILHVGNGVAVIDRIQTGGPGQLNIPTEKINELGNYKSVATVRDTPDLSFTLESFDVSTEVEEMFVPDGDPSLGIDLAKSLPTDIASQFKAGEKAPTPFQVASSVALPYLTLEQMSYRFGLRDNATQTATLRGDTIFYNPGATHVQLANGTNTANQTVVTGHPAYMTAEGEPRRILAVTVGDKRLAFGADYTESYGTVTNGAAVTTITIADPVPTGTGNIRIVFASPDVLSYPQNVHPDTTVKPAAVKGRDIEIYVGGYDPADRPASQANRLNSVQSVNVDWRVQLEKDEEFGNYYAVAQDFEVPTVNGTVDIKPRDNADLMALLRKVTGVSSTTAVIGASTAVPLELDVVIKNPETGDVIKRLHVPDARFSAPGYQGRVLQKLTVSLSYESDEGTLLVFDA